MSPSRRDRFRRRAAPIGKIATVRVRRQLLMMFPWSADDRYALLNKPVCICEGAFDPRADSAHINVFVCTSELWAMLRYPD
jgi:hypothetical protein